MTRKTFIKYRRKQARQQPVVRVVAKNRSVVITPPLPLLVDHFGDNRLVDDCWLWSVLYTVAELDEADRRPESRHMSPVNAGEQLDESQLKLPVALLPQVLHKLQQHKIRSQLDDQRLARLPTPTDLSLRSYNAQRLHLAIAKKFRGLIDITFHDLGNALITALEDFPPLNVPRTLDRLQNLIVVAGNKTLAFAVARYLRAELNEPVQLVRKRWTPIEQRIVVVAGYAAVAALHLPAIQAAFLVLDNRSSTARLHEAIDQLTMHQPYLPAFVVGGPAAVKGQEQLLHQLVGDWIHLRHAPVVPHRVNCKVASVSTGSKSDPLAGKKAAWTDPKRNKWIATLAQAFFRRDVQSLRCHGLFARKADAQWLRNCPQPPHVVVAVEGCWEAVAAAEHQLTAGSDFAVSMDLADAFDHVPHRPLLDVLEQRLGQMPRVVGLIKTTLGAARRGIPQGAPHSPLLFNLFVDERIDRPCARAGLQPLRYSSLHDQLLAAIAVCQYAADRAAKAAPDAGLGDTWSQTYDVVFECYNDVIKPLTAMLGLRHEWCDPDMNYDDDVKAFFASLDDLKE